MKHTLRFILSFTLLLSGILSFAGKKTSDNFACPTATISYVGTPFCSSDTSVKAVTLTGTDAYLGGTFSSMPLGLNLNPSTGAITPSSSTPGFYTITYTIPSGPGCPSVVVTTVIEIVEQVNAGTDGTIYICENNPTPIDLFSVITGEQAGGVWTRVSGSGGTFNAVTGTFTLSPGVTTTSSFSYTVIGTPPCSNDSSVATVIIGSAPTGISISGSTAICLGSSTNLTFTGTPGTTITWNANNGVPMNIILDGSGNATIAVSPTVNTTYNLTNASLNGCNIPLIQTATVTVNATPQFITQIPDIMICNGSMLNIASQLTSTVPGTTFIWSATTSNVNMSAISGDHTNIDQIVNLINGLQTGTISILIAPVKGNCTGAMQEILITVKAIPAITSTFANNSVICNNQYVTFTLNSNQSSTAYNWQVSSSSGVQVVGGATSGTFVPDTLGLQLALTNSMTTGTISFNFTPVNGTCIGATVMNAVTITVNPQPGSPIGLPNNEICSGEITNLNISSFLNIPGTMLEWTVTDSQNATGFTPNGIGLSPINISDLLVNTSNVQGFVQYSVTSKLGNCYGNTTHYMILVNPLPNAGSSGSILISEASTTPIDLFSIITGEQAGGTWTRISGTGGTFDAGTATFTPGLGTTDSDFNYKVSEFNTGCENNSFATINIQPLSSESFMANTIKLSPNPVTDILNIENKFQINSIKIYNQLGQMVFGKEINNTTTQLDLSVINSGIYNVLIETEKGTVNHKIVKK